MIILMTSQRWWFYSNLNGRCSPTSWTRGLASISWISTFCFLQFFWSQLTFALIWISINLPLLNLCFLCCLSLKPFSSSLSWREQLMWNSGLLGYRNKHLYRVLYINITTRSNIQNIAKNQNLEHCPEHHRPWRPPPRTPPRALSRTPSRSSSSPPWPSSKIGRLCKRFCPGRRRRGFLDDRF